MHTPLTPHPVTPSERTPFACVLACAVAATALGTSSRALAGGPLAPEGEPIATSSYAIDISQGPVLGGSRPTSLAGAYVAIAEGVEGNLHNPAAPAVRPAHSLDWFSKSFGLGLTFPALTELDYYNTGPRPDSSRAPSSFLFLTPAANLMWGHFGLGATLELQHYDADPGSVFGKHARHHDRHRTFAVC